MGTRRGSVETVPHPGHEGVTCKTFKSSPRGGQGDSLLWGSESYGLGRGRDILVVPEESTKKGLPSSWPGGLE